jgi:hypothetical protein
MEYKRYIKTLNFNMNFNDVIRIFPENLPLKLKHK